MFCGGACSLKKALLAGDEAFHHLAGARMDSFQVVPSAGLCLTRMLLPVPRALPKGHRRPHGPALPSTACPVSPVQAHPCSPSPGHCPGGAVGTRLLVEEPWQVLCHPLERAAARQGWQEHLAVTVPRGVSPQKRAGSLRGSGAGHSCPV